MPWIRAAIAVALLTLAPCAGAGSAARKECTERVQKQIDRVNSRMRQRYSAAEGEAMRRQLRTLSEQRAACQKL